MTEEELERIKSAYNSGLKVQIWSCGNWINFDAREYPYGGFSTKRQYRIVGDEYAEKAETEINRLKTENNKLQRACRKWFSQARENKKEVLSLKKENHLLGERCNQLLKDKGDLTDKIADIKANCDLAIEGRDIKIMELEQENNKLLDVINNQDVKIADLEKENAELTERLEDLQEQNSEMFNTIALQEQQIEKMKCCQNCKHLNSLAYGEFSCDLYGECEHYSKWEIKE